MTRYLYTILLLICIFTPLLRSEAVLLNFQIGDVDAIDERDAWVFLDTDGDGIRDRFDWDIDGDNIPNTADEFPFDQTKYGEDEDLDGLANHIDLLYLQGENQDFQKTLYKSGIFLIEAEARFSREELVVLIELLESYPFIKDSIKTIVRRPFLSGSSAEIAKYDSHWRQLTFFHEDLSISEYKATLFHELGHIFQSIFPDEFEAIISEIHYDEYPSNYSSENSDELLAECFLASYIKYTGRNDIDLVRFNNLAAYYRSKTNQNFLVWMREINL